MPPMFTCAAAAPIPKFAIIVLMRSFCLVPCFFFAATLAQAQTALDLPVAPGPFQPTMDSLKGYQCPDWFRDAKFGIWAHWGPQSVPMDGDWYARGIYEQGSGHYQYHVSHYGHPSVFGYKDIIPLWKAEKWDPDRLMKLYKKAGAKYFVSMGSHHDNFFLWNSTLHRWNATKMGPHRDVVGDWQKAAKKNGLRFGVSEHLGASFTWFQPSHGSDKTGPKAGVPYDGADPAYWDLYHQPAEPGDTGWYSNNPKWQQEWFNEIKELVDNYHPDLLYSDGGVPYANEVGMSMIAELYNTNAALHGGKVEAVYNCKQTSDGRWVEDLERGIMPMVDPHPWQTDTSIGDWFYNRNWKYRPIDWVVHTLVDNVSKNGNLLLNVVQRPDGTIDPEVETLLGQMAAWTAVHGEGIFGSRPWAIYGEGGKKGTGGNFKEDFSYSSNDIRFTTKGPVLYAFAMGWPEDGVVTVRTLAKTEDSAQNRISHVSLLGFKGKLDWTQTKEGLVVHLPSQKVSDLTVGLKILGSGFKPVIQPDPVVVVKSDAHGVLDLTPEAAETHGGHVQAETIDGVSNIGYWDSSSEWVSWHIHISKPGNYSLKTQCASIAAGTILHVSLGKADWVNPVPDTGDWGKFTPLTIGTAHIESPGDYILSVKPADMASWRGVNLRAIQIAPVD
jgi:alpha-L-fucosidase